MLSAIVYTSDTGYTKQYAKLLAKTTGLPAYDLGSLVPPKLKGGRIIYMGPMMAGAIRGYKKAADAYRVRAVCAVGMRAPDDSVVNEVRQRHHIGEEREVFYLQGGLDIAKLKGFKKFIMRFVARQAVAQLSKLAQRTPGQEAMLRLASEGGSCVCDENLAEVAAWFKGLGKTHA
ncbi:MAG: hypothetical protein LBN26_06770 [Christensenellaceae bacterium]|jgi:hypothetical protein|nr:hypothetical protein [Christensenellaceae bacterium]